VGRFEDRPSRHPRIEPSNIQELIFKVGKPLLVPSANKADQPPALTGEEVCAIFEGEIDGVIFGSVGGGKPSTVIEIDAADHVKLLRQGR
jgi:L-threonylcarbamoyladenylate synthase